MNTREEILAAFRNGQITAREVGARLRRLPGIRLGMAPRTVEIFAAETEVDAAARTITGTITMFGVESSDGRIIEPGAFTSIREPWDRVKLLIDHDHTNAVGYMTDYTEDNERARATFHVPETPEGDDALNRAKLKIRNGLSIGAAAQPGGYYWDEDDVIHYTDMELFETSLCAIPAFQDAQVEEVAARLAHNRKEHRMNREQIEAAFAAGQITEAQRDAALAVLSAFGPAADPAPVAPVAPVTAGLVPIGAGVPAEFAAGPASQVPEPVNRSQVKERASSFAEIRSKIKEFAADQDRDGLVRYVNAELGKVGVAQVEGDGVSPFLRPAWLGEVWNAGPEGRPWIESLGGPKELTSDLIEGFRWANSSEYTGTGADVEARQEIYPGNFEEVPTGTRKLVKVTTEPDQWGVGVKVDNIFRDLGSDALIDSLFTVFARDYDQDSDKHIRDEMVAAATAPEDELGDPIVDATVLAALTGATMAVKRIGGRLNRVWLAENIFAEFAELKVGDLPAWLANQLGFVDLSDGSVTVSSGLRMDVDFGLPAGTMIAYDSRAATPYEKSNIRLQATDVAHRATDIGMFSYGGLMVNDPRAIIKRTIA